MKKRNALLLLLCLLVLLPVCPAAYAASEVGSLTVTDVDSPVCLYYAADAGGNLSEIFETLPLGNILDDKKAVQNAGALWKYAREQELYDQIETPDASGKILFSALDVGIYLVASYEDDFLPFLIQVPLRVDGTFTYDVEAKPKQGGSDPTVPSQPDDPGTPGTGGIPQTGNSVIPMYALLALGTALTFAGLYEMIQGRKENHEQ